MATAVRIPLAADDPATAIRARGPRVAGSTETRVARLAMAAAALWVLDDAFWHREPGTSVTDHIARGLVPTALALLLVVAYPRLRAGARAAAALVAGSLMIVGGVVDGARHVAVDRLAGDDVTAIIAAIAGTVLVAMGAAVLWRSRRLDERPLRRYSRRALIAVVAALGGVFAVMPVAFAIVANHKARTTAADVELGRPYVDVSLRTSDGLRIAGWYVPSRNGAAVIAFPGREGPVRHAQMLVRHGYGVLLLDRRGEGESEGDFNARGWNGEPDLRAAVAYLRGRPDVHGGRVGGLGLSVGGELLLQTAAREPGLRAVVSEGAGLRSAAEQKHMPGAPPEPLRWIAPITMETAAGVALSDSRPPTDLADLMPRIAPRPVLLSWADISQSTAARSDSGWPLRSRWRCPRTVSSTGAPSSSR
jgi:uncharacterized protein